MQKVCPDLLKIEGFKHLRAALGTCLELKAMSHLHIYLHKDYQPEIQAVILFAFTYILHDR